MQPGGVRRNRANVYFCLCGVVEYHASENVAPVVTSNLLLLLSRTLRKRNTKIYNYVQVFEATTRGNGLEHYSFHFNLDSIGVSFSESNLGHS